MEDYACEAAAVSFSIDRRTLIYRFKAGPDKVKLKVRLPIQADVEKIGPGDYTFLLNHSRVGSPFELMRIPGFGWVPVTAC